MCLTTLLKLFLKKKTFLLNSKISFGTRHIRRSLRESELLQEDAVRVGVWSLP